MEKVYIFGHRNPDTDSVTSAIALAYLKEQLGVPSIPAVLSSINNETKYVLDYFKVDEPIFLNDVKINIKDLDYKKNYTIFTDNSIYEAYHKMSKVGISKIPVVGKNKNLVGIVSMKDIAKEQFLDKYNIINTKYTSILEVLNGEELNKVDDEIKGNLIVAGYRSTTFMTEIKLTTEDIIIVGDRHSIIEYAINSKVKLIILTGNTKIQEEHLKQAKKNKVNIIRTNYETLRTTKVFNLCNNVDTIMNNDTVLCIDENQSLSDFISIANKTRYSYYPVMDANNKCLGILRYSDIGYNKRKKVILVDHNSYEQSAIGLEEAEVLEIIDHHNIGTVGTNMPISFRNMPVGSTNTIIFILFKENNKKIPKQIAGLMLSGILSDTLILNSPTTTKEDIDAVLELSQIVKLNYQEYGLEMIKIGSSLKGKTKEEILYNDFKTYTLNNKKIGLSQIFTTNVEEIFTEKDEYITLLNSISKNNDYRFVILLITDIIKNGTYFIYSKEAEELMKSAFNLQKIEQGIFLKNIISRKKQILPKIMNQTE